MKDYCLVFFWCINVTGPLNNTIICTDLARKTIKHKDENGKIQTDHNLNNISKQFYLSYRDKCLFYVNELDDYYNIKYEETKNEEYVMNRISIQQIGGNIMKMSNGGKPDKEFKSTFVKLCAEKSLIDKIYLNENNNDPEEIEEIEEIEEFDDTRSEIEEIPKPTEEEIIQIIENIKERRLQKNNEIQKDIKYDL